MNIVFAKQKIEMNKIALVSFMSPDPLYVVRDIDQSQSVIQIYVTRPSKGRRLLRPLGEKKPQAIYIFSMETAQVYSMHY